MDARALDRYIGIPYCEQTMDCADLAVLLQRELFGRDISLPGRRQRMAAPRAAIERMVCGTDAMSGELADRIEREDLRDGDLVLMRSETLHIGTVFNLSGALWVLHAFENVGYSTLHRLRDLPALGLSVEGFYRCK